MNFECRSSVGVLIGTINILGFTATLIYVIKILCDFGQLSDETRNSQKDVISKTVMLLCIILAICIIAIILSILLIVGIIKKLHFLMAPWLVCAFFGIVCHTFRIIVGFFSGLSSDIPAGDVVLSFIVGLLALGLQSLIFYVIFTLYRIIKLMKNAADSQNETDGIALSTINDNPPSYGDLERNGQLRK